MLGLVIMKLVIENPVNARMISRTNIELKYIAIENENNINGMALIFAFLLIEPLLFQSLIFFPNIWWFKSQFSNFLDDLAKNHTDTRMNGVVGIIGRKSPIKPHAKNNNPKKL